MRDMPGFRSAGHILYMRSTTVLRDRAVNRNMKHISVQHHPRVSLSEYPHYSNRMVQNQIWLPLDYIHKNSRNPLSWEAIKPERNGTERNRTGSNCCTIRTWTPDMLRKIGVNMPGSSMYGELILHPVLRHEDGTSTQQPA